MKPITTPRISSIRHSSLLDSLATSALPDVRVANSIFVGIMRPPVHGSRVEGAFQRLLRGFDVLQARQPQLVSLINHSRAGIHLQLSTIESENLAALGTDHPVKDWFTSAPAYGALLSVPEDDDDALAALAAAYVKCQFTGEAVSGPYSKKVLNQSGSLTNNLMAVPLEQKNWFSTYKRDLAYLRELAAGTDVDSDQDFQRAACTHFIWRSKFPGLNDRHGLVHHRALTKRAMQRATKSLRIGFAEGNGLAAAIGAAFFSGLNWELAQKIPLQAPVDDLDQWVIWLDLNEGCFHNNLNPIVREAASARGNENYIPATREFPRHLPTELVKCLLRLFQLNPAATTLGDLCGTKDIPSQHAICVTDGRVFKTSIARLFNSRSSISKMLGISGPVAALCLGEFARVAHSKFFYSASTRNKLDEALARVAAFLGWGPIRLAADPNTIIGPEVVPLARTVAAIALDLATAVLQAAPPKRYTWPGIRTFHNAFADYCAFLISLGLLGRDRRELNVIGASSAPNTHMVGVGDKATSNFAGATPVITCGPVRMQIQYWFDHLSNLIVRMEKLGVDAPLVLSRIDGIRSGEIASLLFKIDDHDTPMACGSHEAYASVSDDLSIKADSARHLWEMYFSEADIKDEYIDAQSRRKVHWSKSWHSTSTLRGAKLRRVICTAQERALAELEISAVRGLVK